MTHPTYSYTLKLHLILGMKKTILLSLESICSALMQVGGRAKDKGSKRDRIYNEMKGKMDQADGGKGRRRVEGERCRGRKMPPFQLQWRGVIDQNV